MSKISKVAFGGSIAFAVTTSTYVHVRQKYDRESLREGVYKDLARQEMKKIQNVKLYQDQQEIDKILRQQRAIDQKKEKEAKLNAS